MPRARSTKVDKAADQQARPNIGLEIRYTMRAFTRVLSCIAAREGLTASEFRILRSLEQSDFVSQAKLAELTAMERPHVSTLLKQLGGKKLVKASTDQTDRRRVIFGLTDEGNVICARILAQLDQVNARSFDGISDADFETLIFALSRLRKNLSQVVF